MARIGIVGFVGHVFVWRIEFVRLEVGDGSTGRTDQGLSVGDGSSKDIPTGSEDAFTDVANLTKVRRASSRLR